MKQGLLDDTFQTGRDCQPSDMPALCVCVHFLNLKQISQATKTLHTAEEDFNKVDCNIHRPLPHFLQVDELKNREEDLWLPTEFKRSSSPVLISVKRKSVHPYNLLDQAKEAPG